MSKVLVDKPGVSIVAIDPGGTTGLAVWDSWDQRLYIEQVDAGLGKKVRLRDPSGFVVSRMRRNVEQELAESAREKARVKAGRGLGRGRSGEMEVLYEVEARTCALLADVVMAVGPRAIVVCEDFILGYGVGSAVVGQGSGRGGLSPVRLATRLHERLLALGVFNGDAWRMWQGHGWAGADVRGWRVSEGVVPELLVRIRAVQQWRYESVGDEDLLAGVVWGGGGSKWVMQTPAQRLWLPGGKKAVQEWLEARGMWVKGRPHSMDALMHAQVAARRTGALIHAKPERVFDPWRIGHSGG